MHAGSVETPKSAEKWEEKCTPVRRGSAGVSVQEEANCTPAASRRPYRRRYGMKMHAGEARKCRGFPLLFVKPRQDHGRQRFVCEGHI